MIDFRAMAKLAGLNEDLIEDLAKQLKLEDADKAYERGQREALSKINTLIEITLIAVKNNPALVEVGETIKRWMKQGIDPLSNLEPVHKFIKLTEDKWYHPDKNIIILKYSDNFYGMYLPHHTNGGFQIPKEELESVLVKLS